MLGIKQQTWLAVDIGGRWIKCARYVVKHGHVHVAGSQVIDIQAEGLLSSEEVAAAIGRVFSSAGEHPLAVVLPQASAVSQVMDLPGLSAEDRSGELEEEILELTGLSAERCVYDSKPLTPGGGFSGPQWVTIAKEENLSRHIAPLLGQGLNVEAATTGGNALVAAFRAMHPGIENACLVDLGATQTTLVRLRRGEPVQMTSLIGGGENWTEALLEPSGEAFDEVEARLFREDLFADSLLGQALHDAVGAWRERVTRQFDEWREESFEPDGEGSGSAGIYLFGGYSAIRGLNAALTQSGGASWNFPEKVEDAAGPGYLPSYGAVLMAAGISGHRASVLPRSLAKMRKRRRNLSRLKSVVLYLFILVAIVLGVGIFRQQARLEHLMLANREADETLSEMEAAAELLDRHDALGARIEPIIRGQLKTRDSLESFRRIQRVHEDFDFTLIRFVDGRTYFHGMDERAESDKATEATEAGAGARSSPREGADEGSRTFVVELTIPGGQAERLQVLGDIVGRLREEQYFANVDRLLDRPGVASAVELSGKDRSYALLLTLTGERPVAQGEKKGAGL